MDVAEETFHPHRVRMQAYPQQQQLQQPSYAYSQPVYAQQQYSQHSQPYVPYDAHSVVQQQQQQI